MTSEKPPYLGFGLGLRPQHYQEILEGSPAVDWFEVISENYMERVRPLASEKAYKRQQVRCLLYALDLVRLHLGSFVSLQEIRR